MVQKGNTLPLGRHVLEELFVFGIDLGAERGGEDELTNGAAETRQRDEYMLETTAV
jgi:hypothetical protein